MAQKKLIVALCALALCSCVSQQEPAVSGSSLKESLDTSEAGGLPDGFITHAVRFFLDGEVVKTLSVEDGGKMDAPSSDEFKGYVIDHWYLLDGGVKTTWSFTGGAVTSDLDLYAEFEYATYTVKILDVQGEEHQTSATYKQAYDFSSFFDEPTLSRLDHLESRSGASLSVKGTWTLTSDATLTPALGVSYEFYALSSPLGEPSEEATYEVTTYEEQLDGEKITNPNSKVVAGKSASLNGAFESASMEGYRFEGWFMLSEQSKDATSGLVTWSASKIEKKGDAYRAGKAYGLFSKYYAVCITPNSLGLGSVSFVGKSASKACSGDKLTVQASASKYCLFDGWYSNGTRLADTESYTFSMPSSDFALEAKFVFKEGEEANFRRDLALDPILDSKSNTLTYGIYPQKRVSDKETLDKLNKLTSAESNGWYLFDGEFYAKKEANTRYSDYAFDDGETIYKGTTYWFKCEPIEWKILSSAGGEYSLVSSLLLDAHRYNEVYKTSQGKKDGVTKDDYYANDYGNSEIRSWLNGAFLSSAFALESSKIQETNVANSASTTDSSSNKYACSDTTDKVYLLSHQDYQNTSYFADSSARECKTTDWTRSSGAWSSTKSAYLGNGYYWTRSPDSSYSYCAMDISDFGTSCAYSTDSSLNSVRPAITIEIA